MSYFNATVYRIVPKKSYRIVRGCPGCGRKTGYCNSGNFRVNANKSRIDVWLIYRCEKCSHTYNLTIYERIRPAEMEREEYLHFLQNDARTAIRYGTDKTLFSKNKAEIDWEEISYDISPVGQVSTADNVIVIENPYELRLRTDKVLAEILRVTRSRVRQMVKEKKLEIPQNFLGIRAEITLLEGEIRDE